MSFRDTQPLKSIPSHNNLIHVLEGGGGGAATPIINRGRVWRSALSGTSFISCKNGFPPPVILGTSMHAVHTIHVTCMCS